MAHSQQGATAFPVAGRAGCLCWVWGCPGIVQQCSTRILLIREPRRWSVWRTGPRMTRGIGNLFRPRPPVLGIGPLVALAEDSEWITGYTELI